MADSQTNIYQHIQSEKGKEDVKVKTSSKFGLIRTEIRNRKDNF